MQDLDKITVSSKYKSLDNKSYFISCPPLSSYKDLNSSYRLNIDPKFSEYYLKFLGAKVDKNKSLKLYREGFLLSLRYSQDSQFLFVKGRVCAEMYKQVVYIVDIKFFQQLVFETQCECKAGMAPTAHCKHVFVLFEAISDFQKNNEYVIKKVCTDQLQTFNQCKRFTYSPIKARDLNLAGPSKKKQVIDFDPRPAKFRKRIEYQSAFRSACINFSSEYSEKFPELQLFGRANVWALNHDHSYDIDSFQNQFLRANKLLELTEDSRNDLELSTRGQSGNKIWHHERSMRLNSSVWHDIVTASDEDKVVTNLLYSTADLSNVPAVKHGQKYEIYAIRKFEIMKKCKTFECGLFASLKYPFLASSPDRLVNDQYVVEVKCPYSAVNKFISPQTVSYLSRNDEGKLILNKNNPQGMKYYTQIQGQLYCTDRQFCFFVIYTLIDCQIIEIKRDDDFITKTVEKLVDFYNYFFKTAMLDKFLFKLPRTIKN